MSQTTSNNGKDLQSTSQLFCCMRLFLPSCQFLRLFFSRPNCSGRIMLYIWTKRTRAWWSIYPVPRIFDKQRVPDSIQPQLRTPGGKQHMTIMTSSFGPLAKALADTWTQHVSKLQVRHAVKLEHTVARNPVAVKRLMGPRKTFSALCVNCDRAAYYRLRVNFSCLTFTSSVYVSVLQTGYMRTEVGGWISPGTQESVPY